MDNEKKLSLDLLEEISGGLSQQLTEADLAALAQVSSTEELKSALEARRVILSEGRFELLSSKLGLTVPAAAAALARPIGNADKA